MVRILMLLFMALQLAVPARLPAQRDLGGFVLIGNRTGVEVADARRVREIFRGETTIWPSREEVVVALPSARSEFADRFAQNVMGLSRTAMQRFWVALVFQGRASPPVYLNSATELVDFVRRTPGAVAMVPVGTPVPDGLLVPVRE